MSFKKYKAKVTIDVFVVNSIQLKNYLSNLDICRERKRNKIRDLSEKKE